MEPPGAARSRQEPPGTVTSIEQVSKTVPSKLPYLYGGPRGALQNSSRSMFSSSLWPRTLRGSKMLSRRPPEACFRALCGSGGSEAPNCPPEGLLEHVFELCMAQGAQRPQNARQKASWGMFSSSLWLRMLRGSKMLSRRPPGACFRALCGARSSEARK